jgi:preprotein translocase subunit SecY
MMFPPILFEQLARVFPRSAVLVWIRSGMEYHSYTYNVLYMLLIFLFAYFWVTVQFQPREMAKNLRDSGSFIPGLRPGRRTAEYLETVMMRITYYGAAFLAAIAIIPMVVSYALDIDPGMTAYLGGTGLLIVVSVSLDLVQKIEANLLMRSYEGFTSSGRIKGAYA